MSGLGALIRSDFAAIRARDPAARGALETALTYPGLHAIFAHRLAHRLWRAGLRGLARLMSYLARMVTGIDIHPGAQIGAGFFIDHGSGVVIGETAEVGRDVTLYHGVTLGGVSWSPGKRHPTLEDEVMVGAGAKILGPITVGAGARVGANSVVVEEVPPEATVVGIPARIVHADEADRPGSPDPYRVDLNHHLMPDPVGKTLARLADRVAFLEARLAARDAANGRSPGPKARPANPPETRSDMTPDLRTAAACDPFDPHPH